MAIWILLEWAGIFVFAMSGGLAAARRELDPFGFMMLGFLPAVGGGTLRDLVLDRPVFWVADPLPLVLIIVATATTYFFAAPVARRERLLRWMDAVGLSIFAALGARQGLLVTGDPMVAVVTGLMTAVAGGVIRDVVCNEIPLLLRGEIYAAAAVAGALAYVLCVGLGMDDELAQLPAAATAFALRAAGLIKGWSLPGPPGSRA